MSLWMQDGALLINGDGALIDCDVCPCTPAGTIDCASNPDELMQETQYVRFTFGAATLDGTMTWDGTAWAYELNPNCATTICGNFHIVGFVMTCTSTPGVFAFDTAITTTDDCVFQSALGDGAHTNRVILDYSPFHMTLEIDFGGDPTLAIGVAGCPGNPSLLQIEISETPFP